MSKPLVFISHISEEKEVAVAFKSLIEESFLGMIDLFVSSDHLSVPLGQRWLDDITSALKNCVVEIIICSPKSVVRPWINFEAGSGWVRDIPVIPLCHSGMEPSNLPIPLNLLQAAKATEVSSLKLVLPVLAQSIGAQTPSIDLTNFINRVKEFEDSYTFWDECNAIFKRIHNINPKIIVALQELAIIKMELTESEINQFRLLMPFLEKHNIARFQQLPYGTVMSNLGTFYQCELIPLPKLEEIINNTKFKISGN